MIKIIRKHKFRNDFYQMLLKKRSCLELHIGEIETLAVGGSHLQYAINPAYFKSCAVNMGFPSLDWFGSWYILNRYGPKMKNLKTVILRLSIFTPGFELIKTKESWRCLYYKRVLGIPYKVIGFVRGLKKRPPNKIVNCDDNYRGYVKETNFLTNVNIDDRVFSHLKNFYRKTEEMSYFYKIIDWCKKNNIRVIVCLPPQRSDYLEQIPDCIHKKLLSFVPEQIEVYDFWGHKDFPDKYMGDTDHLNDAGAKKFSKILSNIIEKHDTNEHKKKKQQ